MHTTVLFSLSQRICSYGLLTIYLFIAPYLQWIQSTTRPYLLVYDQRIGYSVGRIIITSYLKNKKDIVCEKELKLMVNCEL